MTYEYFCEECQEIIEKDYDIGKAKETIKCPDCKKKCERFYGSTPNFLLKGYGWTKKAKKMNREQSSKNKKAEKRMRKEHEAPKTVAYDYGNGDVREAK